MDMPYDEAKKELNTEGKEEEWLVRDGGSILALRNSLVNAIKEANWQDNKNGKKLSKLTISSVVKSDDSYKVIQRDVIEKFWDGDIVSD